MRAKLFRQLACIALVLAFCFAVSFRLLGKQLQTDPDLTAHEWGTFTSVAGSDGQAVDWLPLSGSTTLPNFVETFQAAKVQLRGTIRMETPVLYFYSPRETTLSVKVAFAKGLITEWYPHASRVAPTGTYKDIQAFQKKPGTGTIAWDTVNLVPGLKTDFRRENQDDRYYAARETTSTPLRIKTSKGDQQEKFLFYRGVSAFGVPISAKLTPEGKVAISGNAVPNLILFERRGDKLGYRVGGTLQGEMTLDRPELTGTIESLNSELERILVGQGLFADEAHAMVETWRSSWSEEGSRLFYVVPRPFRRYDSAAVDPSRSRADNARLRRTPRTHHSRNRTNSRDRNSRP